MVRLLASLVRMPVMWYSTNSIMGAGSQFSGGDKKKKESKPCPEEKVPEPTPAKKDEEVILLEKLIVELGGKIDALENEKASAETLLTGMKERRRS